MSPTLEFGFAPLADRVVFRGSDAVHGAEPWITDGTRAGTTLLAELRPGPVSSLPHSFHAVGDRVFFAAEAPGLGSDSSGLASSAGAPFGEG